MKTRLALVAFKEAGKGPWIRSRGNETGIRVRGLKEGECVVAFYEGIDGVIQPWLAFERNDTFVLPERWTKIQFQKECKGDATGCTHVDLLVA